MPRCVGYEVSGSFVCLQIQRRVGTTSIALYSGLSTRSVECVISQQVH